jgi:VIT1/CCC1 family predicted Fe2+/Mn2+ transporter
MGCLSSVTAIVCSIVVASATAMIIGGLLSEESSGTWYLGALRQLGHVILTGAVTYGIGRICRTLGATTVDPRGTRVGTTSSF